MIWAAIASIWLGSAILVFTWLHVEANSAPTFDEHAQQALNLTRPRGPEDDPNVMAAISRRANEMRNR